MSPEPQLLPCPFCGEDDFDLLGLQFHLQRGWCEVYGTLTIPPNTIDLTRKEKGKSTQETVK